MPYYQLPKDAKHAVKVKLTNAATPIILKNDKTYLLPVHCPEKYFVVPTGQRLVVGEDYSVSY